MYRKRLHRKVESKCNYLILRAVDASYAPHEAILADTLDVVPLPDDASQSCRAAEEEVEQQAKVPFRVLSAP